MAMRQKVPITESRYYVIFAFLTFLFFMWGFAMTMADVLNKHFQDVLHISKSKSSLIQLSTFGAYAVMGLPTGLYIKWYGYKNGVIMGLFLYACGAFLFIPAANSQSFLLFRIALFILACGMATLETVAHPFIASLGDQRSSDQRINLAQSFNGLGGVVGPLIGSYFILREKQEYADDLLPVKNLYLLLGLIITIVAIAFYFIRVPLKINSASAKIVTESVLMNERKHIGLIKDSAFLFSKGHFKFAVIAQFFNVAAQGGTWAYFINYGHEVMHFSAEKAGYFFGLSIFILMLGRFAGTAAMHYMAPNKLLSIFAIGNILMCIIVAQGWGWCSFGALIMINFFFSIMFPTIFSLGLKDLGVYIPQGASFIVMGVVGGALFPPLMGLIADHNIMKAYYLPIVCYCVIALFGLKYPGLRKVDMISI